MSVMKLGLQGPGISRGIAVREVGFRVGTRWFSKRHLHIPWDAPVRSPRCKMADESTTDTSKRELAKLVVNYDLSLSRQKICSFQTQLNKASKWLVSSTTAAVILWRHDEHALWAFIGATVSGAVGKTLKYLINDKRPESACGRKEDPGMPSSHAQGFMYLSTYASLGLLTGQGLSLWTISSACALLLTGAYLVTSFLFIQSWLRVADGLHTTPQIMVGGILGSTVACSWLWCWRAFTEQALQVHPTAKYHLFAAAGMTALAYLLVLGKNWRLGQY